MKEIRRYHAGPHARSGLTLFELLFAIAIGALLMWLLVNSVIKARQRALVAALVEDGGRTDLNADGTVRMLDLSSVATNDLGDNLERMSRLDSLFALNLDHTPVTREDLASVFQPMDLAQLHLCGTNISDAAVDVIVSQPLEFLDARATYLSDDGIRELAENLPRIRNLRLSETWITDAGLKPLLNLKNLQTLDLRVTDISDAGLGTIRQMSALKTVRLNATRVTEEGAKALKRARPELKIEFHWPRRRYHEFIGLSTRKFFDQNETRNVLLAPMSPVIEKTLKAGHVYQCTIDEEMSPDVMQRLPCMRLLQTLQVHASWLKPEHLSELWKNHRLETVTMSGAGVTDDILPMLTRCRNIQSLDFSHANMTGEKLSELQHCHSLYQLNLRNTELSEEGFRQLGTLTSLPLNRLFLSVTSQDRRLTNLLDLEVMENGSIWLEDGRFAGRRLTQLKQRLEVMAPDAE